MPAWHALLSAALSRRFSLQRQNQSGVKAPHSKSGIVNVGCTEKMLFRSEEGESKEKKVSLGNVIQIKNNSIPCHGHR